MWPQYAVPDSLYDPEDCNFVIRIENVEVCILVSSNVQYVLCYLLHYRTLT